MDSLHAPRVALVRAVGARFLLCTGPPQWLVTLCWRRTRMTAKPASLPGSTQCRLGSRSGRPISRLRLTDSEYDAGHALQTLGTTSNVATDESLHLSVSMRSFRAEHVSRFGRTDREIVGGSSPDVGSRYPIPAPEPGQVVESAVAARGSERWHLVHRRAPSGSSRRCAR